MTKRKPVVPLPVFVVAQLGVAFYPDPFGDPELCYVDAYGGSCPPELSYWDGAPGWEERIQALAEED